MTMPLSWCLSFSSPLPSLSPLFPSPSRVKPNHSEELRAINEGNAALRTLPEGVNMSAIR